MGWVVEEDQYAEEGRRLQTSYRIRDLSSYILCHTELFLQPSCPFPPSHLTCKNTIGSSCFKWGYDTLAFVSNAADRTLSISCVGFQPEEGKRVDTEQQMGLPLVIFLHPSYLASLTCTDFIKGHPFTLDSSWVWLMESYSRSHQRIRRVRSRVLFSLCLLGLTILIHNLCAKWKSHLFIPQVFMEGL